MPEYLVAIRSGRFDLAALKNLNTQRKDQISPLISVRGTSLQDFDNFVDDWGDRLFYLDISRQPKDLKEPRQQPDKPQKINILLERDLNNPKNAYENKRSFYSEQLEKNKNIVPVVSWRANDPIRDIARCAILLNKGGEQAIGVRIPIGKNGEPSNHSKEALSTILNSLPTPEKCVLIFDYQHISSFPSTDEDSWIFKTLSLAQNDYNIERAFLLSTSFPKERPDNGSSMITACLDWEWQATLRNSFEILGYGDYATSDPDGEMDFIPGMPTIPYAGYFSDSHLIWWTKKEGKDKEFSKYIGIAKEIVRLDYFHDDDFCWATIKYEEIASLGGGDKSGYGNNGVWLGFRINQHVAAMLNLANVNDSQIDEEIDLF
ncbi:beta family protein [Chromohalobacter israelensis]|uniref:beta family protein n=1 Tax=Chromohalobacter israelensis TaxID=141390 RepID=UPI000FFE6367|nr:hypothetical protein [Chromohalobacter salexigens]RXE48727.1 hypothetical protein B4O83_12410 [Chromohalobacter salexigens]